MQTSKVALVVGVNRGMGLKTSADALHSGGYDRNFELIDW